jgi:CHAD domain-containing protein
MSFELKPGQSVRKGVRRLAREQMDDALAQLAAPRSGARDNAVHEIRKALKKVRAVLRLVRPVIAKRAFRAENTCLRDAGRPLTEVRDAKILIETLDALARHFKRRAAARSFGKVRRALGDNLRGVRKRVVDEGDAFAVVGADIRRARKRIKDWADVPDKWSSIGSGLEEVYRTASRAFEDAARDPTVEKLHEWRKQAKYLHYQLEVFRPLWPERPGEVAGEADRMGELLGDDHDLAVLRQTLTDDPERFGNGRDTELLLALIDRRRAELEEEFMPLGQRFFQDSPKRFAGRLKGYWKTSRARGESEGADAAQLLPATSG